jgi:hypothetical protein
MANRERSTIQGRVFGDEDEIEGIGADGVDGLAIVHANGASKGNKSKKNGKKIEHDYGSPQGSR